MLNSLVVVRNGNSIRHFSRSVEAHAWKPARTSSNFTFATKYPSPYKKPTLTKKPNVKKSGQIKKTQFAISPDRRLATSLEKYNLSQTVSYMGNSDITHAKSFSALGLNSKLVEAIKEQLAYIKPSQVQIACINHLLDKPNENFLVGSQTGSGKTLAYLAPVMHLLKAEEESFQEAQKDTASTMIDYKTASGVISRPNVPLLNIRKLRRPRCIILLPSRQLIEQVTAVAKKLARVVKLRVLGMHGATKHVNESLAQPVDILICTPGRLAKMIKDQDLYLSQTSRIVLDEADTLFDDTFLKETETVLKPILHRNASGGKPTPILLITATFPQTLEKATSQIPNLLRLMTPSLHTTPSGLHQQFLRIGQSNTKQNMLIDVLKRAVLQTKRILIFCNTKETTESVYAFLESKKYNVRKLCSSLDSKTFQKNLAEFNSIPEELENNEDSTKTITEEVMIAVATDIASRGLDTTVVGHVILYDFPHSVINYMHRVGRTARYGRMGRATSFLTNRDLRLAESIQQSIVKKKRMPSTVEWSNKTLYDGLDKSVKRNVAGTGFDDSLKNTTHFPSAGSTVPNSVKII
ncbi:P-loop containing nucleoside triphosphate hydrolase protein [Globomyces pollinis-pini]|nr:P-loop containing nucleoside triphosphate hydrolase protein [Globomyces pollinis-pini]